MIDEAVFRKVQEAVSLVDIASEYCTLEAAGTRDQKTLCLFHVDGDASLWIDERTYHCFGCGAKGNVFQWVIALEEGIDNYADALLFLADKAGIEIGTITSADRAELEKKRQKRERQQELLEETVAFYHQQLGKSKEGQLYAKSRGLNKKVVLDFKIGYAPRKKSLLVDHLKYNCDASSEELREIQLTNRLGHDFMRDRLVIPQFGYGGVIINLYGRAIDPEAKIPHIYTGKNKTPFNWAASRTAEVIVAVESIIDALNIICLGFPDTIAYFGVQGWKDQYVDEQLRKSKVQTVIILPDHDPVPEAKPGKPIKVVGPGFETVLPICHAIGKARRRPQVAILPEGSDPADFAADATEDDLKQILNDALDPADFATKFGIRPNHSLFEASSDGEMIYRSSGFDYHVDKVRSTARGIQANIACHQLGHKLHDDRISFWSAPKRRDYAREVSNDDLDERNAVQHDLVGLGDNLKLYTDELMDLAREEEEVTTVDPTEDMSDDEKDEAMKLLQSPKLLRTIAEDIEKSGYVGEVNNKVLLYLIATSRKLEKPLSAMIMAQSASGKSSLVEAIMKMMPPEEVKDLSRMTKNAMFYMEEDALKNKFVCIAERQGSEDADYTIRTMQSEKKVSIDVPFKNPDTGIIETVTKTVEGPMAFCETTTESSAEVNQENLTRVFMLTIDDSEEQTKRIQKVQAFKRTIAAMREQPDIDAMRRLHQNAQRLLRPVHVEVPYSMLISFPTQHVRTRRDFDRFLDLITVITFVHQFQRDVVSDDGFEYIQATPWDYEKAFRIASEIFKQTIDEVPPKARELLKAIRDYLLQEMDRNVKIGGIDIEDFKLSDIPFTIRNIVEHTGWLDSIVRQHMRPLVKFEMLVDKNAGLRGKQHQYHFNMDPDDLDSMSVGAILTPQELRARMEGEDE